MLTHKRTAMTLERIILEALKLPPSHTTKKSVLWGEVASDADNDYRAFESALRNLAHKKEIAVIPGEDWDRIKILAAGLARLAE